MVDQFERIRDGDRFWYQQTFSGRELQAIENTTLADVIQRNTDVTNIQDNVFFDPSIAGPCPRPSDLAMQAGSHASNTRISHPDRLLPNLLRAMKRASLPWPTMSSR